MYTETDTTGFIHATGLAPWGFHGFRFEKAGYKPAAAGYTPRGNSLGWDSPTPASGKSRLVVNLRHVERHRISLNVEK